MKVKELASKNRYTFLLIGLMIIVLLFFTITKGSQLWSLGVWSGMTMQFPEYGVITLGLMFCFIAGKIDMSFIALGNIATIMAVRYMESHVTEGMSDSSVLGVIAVAIIMALCIGAVGGVINGALISYLAIPPVMATIAMQLVWQGISIALTNGYAVSGVPALYTQIGHSKIFGFLPFPLFVFIIIYIIAWAILNFTVFGEKIYMLGTNEKATYFSGINTKLLTIKTFVLGDIIAVIGSLLMVSTMASAKADYGQSYLMRCILILVLAGVIPDGGVGKIFNVLIAIVTIQIIASGVNLFANLNAYHASFIWGGLLILVLIMSTRLTGGRLKLPKPKAKKVAQS